MYSIVWGSEHEHIYVYGIEYIIYTDSIGEIRILEERTPRKTIPIRLQRFMSKMSIYREKYRHVSGKNNIADFVSRHMARRPDTNPHKPNNFQ